MTPAGGGITIAELARRLDRLETEILRKLDGLAFVDPETLDTKLMLQDAHREELTRRIAVLEAKDDKRDDEQTANRRLAIGGILTGLVLPILVVVIVTQMGLR